MNILVVNAGSTSLKFKLISFPKKEVCASARIDRIGSVGLSEYSFTGAESFKKTGQSVPDYKSGISLFVNDLGGTDKIDAVAFKTVLAKGYPGVHIINNDVIAGMKAYMPVAPVHNSAYLGAIEAVKALMPDKPLVGSFETAFHTTVPLFRRVYGVPYKWYTDYGVERMGYHGASHSYIAKALKDYSRVVSCHLGGSGSICAIKDGKSIDTSFGFSLQAGITHVSRCGDIDPYIMPYLLKLGLSSEEIIDGLEKEGGLKGISGLSGDMRDLRRAIKEGNKRARLAVDIYTSDITRYIGAFAAEMGGLDALAFTGGIGENDSETRLEICATLGFLGIDPDEKLNASNARRIDKQNSKTPIFVIPADEESVVAENAYNLLKNNN